MKIVICASEVVPFAKTGGLADVAGALPLALEKEGHDVVIVMPGYRQIDKEKFGIQKINHDISFCVIGNNIKVYFIESQQYFDRQGLYQDENGDYKDNLERFAYYCRRTLHLLKEINFPCDIIHVHDWQASLISVYLRTVYSGDKFFKNTRSLLTVHNIGYQGVFSKDEFLRLGLDWELFDVEGIEFYGKINILKGGLVFSDLINTVSPTYSKEIKMREFGFGLEGVLNKRSQSLYGILNGLDYSIWNPQEDNLIASKYSYLDPGRKAINKADLQRSCNLSVLSNAPLFGLVSRLAEQKGIDILSETIEDVCKMGSQIVILGVGDFKYENLLKRAAKRFPEAISLNIRFDDSLAHKIYAGSDFFLMPSRYEPCGLGQMIALKYGSIPIVFKTGGLADTVTRKNGFYFTSYSTDDLIVAVKKAISLFSDKNKFSTFVSQVMKCDFSWKKAAKEYVRLYEKATGK